MAIIFEMQVDFDDDREACRLFCEYMANKLDPFMINGKTINFHSPSSTFVSIPADGWTNITICPMNIGFGVSCDYGDHITMTDDEMFELSLYMYQFIKCAPGYTCALVGWELGDINTIVDNYRKEPAYTADGLVLHKDKYGDFKLEGREEFDEHHFWYPLESAVGNIFGDDDEE